MSGLFQVVDGLSTHPDAYRYHDAGGSGRRVDGDGVIVLLWLLWGALMLALTGLAGLGWFGLLLFFVVGFGSAFALDWSIRHMDDGDDE